MLGRLLQVMSCYVTLSLVKSGYYSLLKDSWDFVRLCHFKSGYFMLYHDISGYVN